MAATIICAVFAMLTVAIRGLAYEFLIGSIMISELFLRVLGLVLSYFLLYYIYLVYHLIVDLARSIFTISSNTTKQRT